MRAYDASTNTISEGAFPRGKRIPLKDFRGGVLDLLESGSARVDGHELVGGRDAIRIVSGDGQMTYLVDASTYDPIEWRKGAGATIRFLLYEELPATPANLALVSVAAQHPTATVSGSIDLRRSRASAR